MKKTLLLFLFLLTYHLSTAQQAPPIEWAVCLGGIGTEGACVDFNTANKQYGLQVLHTPDGGYILAGNTNANSGYVSGFHGSAGFTQDMWVVKTDSHGNFQWQKALGGTGNDSAAAIALTSDGGYIVAGYSTIDNGDVPAYYGANDIWIVKLDGAGNKLWTQNLGTTDDEKAYSIQQTSDGGFIVAGAIYAAGVGPVTRYNMVAIKTDPNGNIEWRKSFGGSDDEVAYSVKQTTDGGYILAGSTQTKNNGDVSGNHTYWSSGDAAYLASRDAWVVKLNAQGVLQWQKCLGGTGEDNAYSIQQTTDGGYILAGYSNSVNGDVTGNHGNKDFWVVKITSGGTLEWQKSLGGSNSDQAHFIKQTPDGGYAVTGTSFSNDGDVTDHRGSTNNNDYWVVKLDASGNKSWAKSLGGTGSDTAFSLDLTADGGYAIAGSTLSNNGDVTGLHTNSSATDFWLVKLGSGNMGTEDIKAATSISLYPNPAKDVVFFSEELSSVEIYTSDGKIVYEALSGKQIDLHHLPANIYFLHGINKEGKKIVKKIVKQ
ncbi:T9SS C-terminal target domain-containing protein [Chryseobacterium carnipullorum]|uniref:T9SS C-terminal target domain-containing protein n=1 Tax=Chryseobacterium carnipullorum TaxID=1124835 RepID=A0A3G6LYZ7_CHRCU|nr:T9SS type A sorting domain-containing protein [Chryseobacterium carnipullorum]AZA48561.1 T9SS C-terminal target domain-containing protein [Chryseobacterium carnipullorum]AZA63484.1 T9SS C-terminal target domain-containing protein [Chryseobacterium carnipullorum]